MAGFAVRATRGLSVEVLAILAICSTPSPVGDMSLLRVTGDWAQRRGAAGAATRDAGPAVGGGAAGGAAGGGAAGVGRPEAERRGGRFAGRRSPGVGFIFVPG